MTHAQPGGVGTSPLAALHPRQSGVFAEPSSDIRPTIMYLLGLRDDYQPDGRVITQILADPNHALSDPAVTALGECYKQLNSSVGEFAANTLQADMNAIESSTTGDVEYLQTDAALRGLEVARDRLVEQIKGELEAAEFQDQPVFGAWFQTGACRVLIHAASDLAKVTAGSVGSSASLKR